MDEKEADVVPATCGFPPLNPRHEATARASSAANEKTVVIDIVEINSSGQAHRWIQVTTALPASQDLL